MCAHHSALGIVATPLTAPSPIRMTGLNYDIVDGAMQKTKVDFGNLEDEEVKRRVEEFDLKAHEAAGIVELNSRDHYYPR